MQNGSMGCRVVVLVLFMLVVSCLTPAANVSADDKMWEIGVRGGWSWRDSDQSFSQIDLFAGYRLPWEWRWWDTVDLSTRLTMFGGVLMGGGEHGALGGGGLEFVFGLGDTGLEVRLGSALTLLSDYTYGDEDLGGTIQFTSHIGLDYWFLENWSATARVQHMSNASIYSDNPGVDIVMLGLRYQF